MKVTTEKMEGSRVLLEVESPEQVVEEALDSAYRKIVKRVEIPGFRRGKAPKSLVARYYASELYDEAIRQAVSEEYLKAVEEAEIQPVDDPEFSDIHFVEGESLRFKASVQVYPEVELEEYNDIAIPFEMPTVSEEDVDEQIEMLKERMAELRPLEGDLVLEPGHYATCHIKTIDAHDDDSLHLQLDIDEDLNYLEVGHEYPVIPGLGETLIGMKKGETREFEAAYPIEGEEQPRTVRFQVEIKEVYEKYIPSTADEIVASLGKSSFDEVREEVRQGILDFKVSMAKEQFVQEVQEELLKRGTFDIPEVMIAERAQNLLDRLQDKLQESGLNFEMYLEYIDKSWEELRSELMEEAEKDVRLDLILDAIGERENIPVLEEEIDKIVESIAAEVDRDPDVVKTTLEVKGGLDNLRIELRRGKVLKMIAERAAANAGTVLPSDEIVDEEGAETSETTDSPDEDVRGETGEETKEEVLEPDHEDEQEISGNIEEEDLKSSEESLDN
ncbi:MAG TPA: trigger factor [Bacillota bacterium]|nr:trigger factor [Bacillota bacterium]HOQ03538.1 trigger factor [Bacillota bacterium]HPV13959.1 trigger factor [Bacillota bacterium]HPZ78851.1 trigger factor [Bacillota bacterium]HQD74995.1 trigger factor [Bacillota bacterium]